MKVQVKWTNDVLERFIIDGCLSGVEEIIIRTRVVDKLTISEQAELVHRSESGVKAIIKRLKEKYDHCQERWPEFYPVRRTSKEEEYMDTH